MAYFHTNYDASSLTVSVDDAEVTRALGVLGNKTPAALKVAVNTTARQTRKLMLTEVKKRYDLNAAGRRMIEDLRQRQKATNRRPTAILAIMKNDPGAFRADLGYFRTSPTKPFMGPSVRNAPPVFRAHVLKGSPMIALGGTSDKSKGFLVQFKSKHIGMVRPEDAVVMGTVWNEKNKPPEGKEKVYRKDYANSRGKAYRKFDANAKELTDYVDGKKILKAKSLEIQVGGATVTISEGGEIKVTSPAGIALAASGELKMTASTITATAGTVNIQGGGGDVVVSGKSLVSHTHTGNLGKETSAPL